MNPELAILQALSLAHPYQVARDVLAAEVRLRGQEITLAELRGRLAGLESAGQAVGITNPDAPGGSKWRITDLGRARLAEAGI